MEISYVDFGRDDAVFWETSVGFLRDKYKLFTFCQGTESPIVHAYKAFLMISIQ